MIVGARRPSTTTMTAARHVEWGSPLQIAQVDRPEPMAGEVRIRVRATSVNPIDMHTGRNAGYEQSMRLPFIPGWDVAGVVDAVGYGVTRHAVGDRVFGLAWFPYPAGTYAEYVTVPAHHVVAMPASASFAEAGCLPMAALTAQQMLDAAHVEPGDRVLVSGASGGVGHLAVQIAADRGAEVVALARPSHHATLLGLGAQVCVDYTEPEQIAAAGRFDAVIDLVGGELGRSLFDRVTRGGSIALATAWSIPTDSADEADRGIHVASCLVEPDPQGLSRIASLVDAGRLWVVIGGEYGLTRAAEAQRWVLDRRGFGKVAIVTDSEELDK
ncbi:NADP-dependent oxidoreductase [Kitasatospora sp. NPDC097643]|uniref:NADP-dependent oxidoreductase n=1 Tax=Kitasatospora sp. NPDC097643 TaxID=3157230 RepID=UPI0033262448